MATRASPAGIEVLVMAFKTVAALCTAVKSAIASFVVTPDGGVTIPAELMACDAELLELGNNPAGKDCKYWAGCVPVVVCTVWPPRFGARAGTVTTTDA